MNSSDTDTSTLPPFDDLLEDLQPTKKLLDFYRRKLEEYEDDYSKTSEALKQFKIAYETQNKLEKDLQSRDDELITLRKALSDLQACLLNEREHVLRLYADNDRLKIRELEDRRKIQHLLYLCGKQFPNADLTGFSTDASEKPSTVRGPPKRVQPNQRMARGKQYSKESVTEDAGAHPLTFQVEALHAQLEDQSRLSREQISALTEDIKLVQGEAKGQRHRDSEKISALREQLKCTQDLLHKMTRDHLQFQQGHRRQEQAWLAQRDRMALKTESLKKALQHHKLHRHSFSSPNLHQALSLHTQTSSVQPLSGASRKTSSSSSKIALLNVQRDLEQCRQEVENYRSQCLRLEENNALLKEERDSAKQLYNNRNESLLNRLKLVKNRYADLERRFKVQMEGYQNDVKLLRTQLQALERQCLKAALKMTESDADVLMLQEVHRNTVQSKRIFDHLRSLKAEIYRLEEDLKHK